APHRHPHPQPQQIDFHQIDPVEQQALTLAEVEVPAVGPFLLVRRREDFDTRDETPVGSAFVNLDEALAELLLDRRLQGHGYWPGRRGRLANGDGGLRRGSRPGRRALDAHVGDEGTFLFPLLLGEEEVAALLGPHQVALRDGVGERARDALDQVPVEIPPEATRLDVRVRARERRLHDGSLRVRISVPPRRLATRRRDDQTGYAALAGPVRMQWRARPLAESEPLGRGPGRLLANRFRWVDPASTVLPAS